MPERYLTKISEIKEQLRDINSTLDEIVENADTLTGDFGKAEAAAYYIGDAIELLEDIGK